MKKTETVAPIKAIKKLECFLADTDELIKEAQALRYRVFAKEMGAKLKTESESGLVHPTCA